jgi:hypothetical protein
MRGGSLVRSTAGHLAATHADWRQELERVLREGDEDLYLCGLYLGPAEAEEVGKALRKQRKAVRRFPPNKLGKRGAKAAAELLRRDTCVLEEVSLNNYSLGARPRSS